jgi:hypothetical protein
MFQARRKASEPWPAEKKRDMKINFKNDYISQTAAHYTTFTLTGQSRQILQENLHDLSDRARDVQSEIGRRASDKALAQMKGGKVDTYG